jgi:hypothetical protein
VRKLVLLVVAVGVLAGCGYEESSNSTSEDANALAAAFNKTNDAGTSRMSFRIRMDANGENVDFGGQGSFDYRRGRGRVDYDLTDLAKVDPESVGIGKMTMVFDGLVFYMQMEGVQSELPPGKRWLKLDLTKVGAGAGADLGGLSQLSQSPAQMLAYLRAASTEIEEVGTETVRGVQTTQYRATVDLRKALELQVEQAPPKFREAMRRDMEESLSTTGLDSIPLDVWIDGEGLPRRMVADFDMTADGEEVHLETAVELFDFGVRVSAPIPPADKVLDVSAYVPETVE